jgi:hypothetical protein
MGGAFVAVANDSSATWWNPAGLADGPFVDIALARAVTDSSRQSPARRDRVSTFAIGTPPVGFSYYRLRLTEIDGFDPTATGAPVREDGQGGIPVRSLAASQLGITVLQTLMPGIHAGTTLKYVRGRAVSGAGDPASPIEDVFGFGDDLDGGDTDHRFDLDIGVLAVAGPVRAGLLVRNLRAPVFDQPDGTEIALPRQVRLGAAFDAAALDALALTVSLDADLRRYPSPTGGRRVVAIGAEQWVFRRRLALRAGSRFNTVGAQERAATVGLTVAMRSGLFLDAHLVRGGGDDDRGWGLAARVSL